MEIKLYTRLKLIKLSKSLKFGNALNDLDKHEIDHFFLCTFSL